MIGLINYKRHNYYIDNLNFKIRISNISRVKWFMSENHNNSYKTKPKLDNIADSTINSSLVEDDFNFFKVFQLIIIISCSSLI